MPKKAGIVFVVLGAVLMLSALLLFLNNQAVDRKAGDSAREVMEQIRKSPEETTEPMETQQTQPTDQTHPEGMTTMLVDGYEYIGYLQIPKLDLELPVMDRWDYTRLQKAPCRHFGATYTDDLVIAAHNYQHHFGRIGELTEGDEVSFTDMDGLSIRYGVVRTDILDPNAVDAVQYSENDLVLYTCTYGGEERRAVFCDRME